MRRASASVGVDLDPIDLHLAGYGQRDLPPDPLVYTVAVPRLLDAFKKAGVRVTFFLVGRDLPGQTEAVRKIVAAGHEVASHSLTHPHSLLHLTPEDLRKELVESKARLEAASGKPVIGFRAPNWDLDESLFPALADAGYRYDASAYPSLYLLPARLLLARNGGAPGLRKWPFTWKRAPYRWTDGTRSLWEFPITVDGLLRYPVYHTTRYRMSDPRFLGILDRFDMAQRPFYYSLHGLDVLGLAEDGVDARLASHPGMDRPLADKQALLTRTLQVVTGHFGVVPFEAQLKTLQPA